MILGVLDFQTFTDAVGLGAIYALMAVGIGLVFGVLRLVNFAYGQLVMAGAYTLAYTSGWPLAASILACFGVVVGLSLAMETAVFARCADSRRPMLVTTFAINLLRRSPSSSTCATASLARSWPPRPPSRPISIFGAGARDHAGRTGVGRRCCCSRCCSCARPSACTRAAAAASTARLLSVRANRVIAWWCSPV